MDDLPQTQTQEDCFVGSQDSVHIIEPWGRLVACFSKLHSIDLVEPSYKFGRATSCNIVVDKTQFPTVLNVSKEHFEIYQAEDGVVFITDLSKNGTFVNDVRLGKNNKMIIYNDDIISIGYPSSKIYIFSCNLNHEDSEYPQEMRLKYAIRHKLGRGAFGEVRLGHHKRTFAKYAIKKISKARSSCNSVRGSPPEKVKTEIEILKSFSYAFIIQMFEVFETDRDVFLVLEYMHGGELTGRILSSVPFPEAEVKFVFYQMLLAVRYLHLHGVTHRDLKPENVLLATDGIYPLVKISDFGLSKIMDDSTKMMTICGTVNYVAPEVLKFQEPYNRKVDIWSLGVILFYMLSKSLPFVGENKQAVIVNIRSGRINWDKKTWNRISATAKDLIRSMLVLDPQERMSAADIFKHGWIEKDATTRYRVEQFLTPTFEDDTSEESIMVPVPKRPRYENVSI